MNFAEIAPDPNAEALKAQAVAARTFASYKSAFFPQEVVGTFNVINNSTEFQVFILGSYNDYPNYQDEVETALNATQGQFLSAGDGHTIDAQFSSDIIGQSLYGNQPYLIPIQEPISSSTCNLPGATGNGWGMSQRGAIRWAKGNTCPDGTGTAWPVKWDYKQILVHYYTGIDIVVDGSGNKVAPDDRWNLLKHGVPSQMTSGITQSVEIWLQNTSTTEWTDAVLGYQWVGTNIPWTEINLPVMPAGKDEKIQVDIIPPSANGTYTLRLDVKHANSSWFSQAGWPDVRIAVTVTGAIATPTPMPIVCTSWNLASDFRIAPNQENPNRDSCNNPGVWEFMTGTGLTRDPLNYSLASYFTPSFQGAVDVNAWSGNSSLSWPFIAYNASSQVQLGLWPPHTINVHPQDNQLAIIAVTE